MSNLQSTNKAFQFITNLFRLPGSKETGTAIETNVAQGYTTSFQAGNGGGFDFYDWFEDNLQKIYEPINGLGLTQTICRRLERKAINDPVLSACFEKLTSLADTKFELELELSGGEVLQEEAMERLNEELPKLFPCCSTLRDVSQLIIQRVILYGVFAASMTFDESSQQLNGVKLPPAWSISWARYDDQWILMQEYYGQKIALNRETFIYEPLWTIQNEKGIFPVPPFKAALNASNTYEIFMESLSQIARRTGMNKVLDIIVHTVNPNAVKLGVMPDSAKIGTEDYNKEATRRNTKIQSFANSFKQTLPNGYIIHPDDFEIKDLATYEPSANIATFHDLLASQVVLGCKLYPAIVGIVTKENQTTLSTNQKLATKAFAESIQAKADSALKRLIKAWLITNNYLIKKCNLEREAPQIDSELEEQQAKKIKLENEMLEMNLEAGETSSKSDEQGNDEKDKKQIAAKPELKEDEE